MVGGAARESGMGMGMGMGGGRGGFCGGVGCWGVVEEGVGRDWRGKWTSGFRFRVAKACSEVGKWRQHCGPFPHWILSQACGTISVGGKNELTFFRNAFFLGGEGRDHLSFRPPVTPLAPTLCTRPVFSLRPHQRLSRWPHHHHLLSPQPSSSLKPSTEQPPRWRRLLPAPHSRPPRARRPRTD